MARSRGRSLDRTGCQSRRRLSRRTALPGHRGGRRAGVRRGDRKKLWTARIASRDKGEGIPSAPIAWDGLVFIGTSGSDIYGVQGRMYALEAQTGKVAWETYTVPTDAPQPGNEKMQAQARPTSASTRPD
jgi:alcohol dehydrogenase (cytochrome c)